MSSCCWILSLQLLCSNEVSSLLKADVNLADIANCQSPPVYVCVSVNECVYVCARIYTKHTAGKNPKESQKWSNLTPGHLSLPEEMIEGAVINYFSACDLQGSILPFPQAYVTPVFLFFNILPSSGCMFYLLPNVPVPHPCSSVVGPACCVVWPSFRCLPKTSISSRWVWPGFCEHFELRKTKIMWWCDTQGTTQGETDLIPFPYKSPPLFRLFKSGKKKKNRCWSNLMWSLWRIRDGNSLWWLHPWARPTLVSHCQTFLHTVPVHEKGLAEPTISGIVSGNKKGVLTVNLHNQSVTFNLRLLQFSRRDENYFPLSRNRPILQQSQFNATAKCHVTTSTAALQFYLMAFL